MREIFDLSKASVAQRRFGIHELASTLNKAYEASRREPSDRAKKSFAPSGIGYGSGRCPRQWYYAFDGGIFREEDTDAVGVANMAYGTEAHARIQKLFDTAGILVEEERKVVSEEDENTPPVFGFADLVINWNGEEVVGEIKTTSQESFVSKKAKQRAAGYHLLQVLLYMKVLGLDKGFLLYENKNTQEMLLIPVVWNVETRKLIDDTWSWMNEVRSTWAERKKPKRPYRSNRSVACKPCAFTKHCWDDEDEGTVDIAPLVVPD